MSQDDIIRLQAMIQERHQCPAKYRRAVPVREPLGEQSFWEGEVAVFWLTGHAKAMRCFAWFEQRSDEEHVVTVLEIPPVIGPAAAVRNAINHGKA